MDKINEKSLVAFFSRAGDNYVSGAIKRLSVGNTQCAAEQLARLTGADLFKIEAKAPYPEDYYQCCKQARLEQLLEARPTLKTAIPDMESYDTIYLGYPIWWGTMPLPVWSFLEEYDFTGKTIFPFCTHEGSDMGWSVKDIQSLCPEAQVFGGLAVHGSHLDAAEETIALWLKTSMYQATV